MKFVFTEKRTMSEAAIKTVGEQIKSNNSRMLREKHYNMYQLSFFYILVIWSMFFAGVGDDDDDDNAQIDSN